MLPAGGLGVAPAMGLIGVVSIVVLLIGVARQGWAVRIDWRRERALLVLAAFFAWAVVSFAWSPWPSARNVIVMAATVPLYAAVLILARGLRGAARLRVQTALVMCCLASVAVFAFELVTGGLITTLSGREGRPIGEIHRNLGHGVSSLVALTPAAIVVLWRQGLLGRRVALGLVAAGLVFGAAFGITSNLVGLALGLAVLLATASAPNRAVRLGGGVAALSIVAAPVLAAAWLFPQEVRNLLPLSWEYRAAIWAFSVNTWLSSPIIGLGFDASRGLEQFAQVRGITLDLMSLHPHSAGLHVLLETGVVGVGLLATALWLTGWQVGGGKHGSVDRQRAVGATLAAGAGMAAVSYGVWQEWWLATGFSAAVACAVIGDEGAQSARTGGEYVGA